MRIKQAFTLLELLIVIAILGSVYFVAQSALQAFSCRKVEREVFQTLNRLIEKTRDDSIIANRALSIDIISEFSGSLRLNLLDFGYGTCSTAESFSTIVASMSLSTGQTRGTLFFQNPNLVLCFDRDGLDASSFPIVIQTVNLCSGREFRLSIPSSFGLPTWEVRANFGGWIGVDFR